MLRDRCAPIPLLVGLVLSVVTLVAPPASATFSVPARPTELPFKPAFDIEVDEAHQLVFVAEGPQGNRVAVMDFDGRLVEMLTVPGAAEVEIVGSTAYVASSTKDKVFAIDASLEPPALVGSFSTGAADDPRYLAYAGGKLWIGTLLKGVFSKDLSAADPPAATAWDDDIVVPRSSPGASNTLWAFYGSGFHRVDVTTDLTEEASTGYSVPDPTAFVVDGTAEDVYLSLHSTVRRLMASDLSAVRDFGPAHPGKLASSSNPAASLFVVNKDNGTILVFDDADERKRTLTPMWWAYDLAATADGTRLFVLGYTETGSMFQVIDPSRSLPRVTIRFPDSPYIVTYADDATIPISVAGGQKGDLVTLYRVGKVSLQHLGNFTLDADGTVEASVAIRDPITVQVLFPGSMTLGPAWSRTYEIEVAAKLTARMRRAYLHDGSYALYHARQTIWYEVTMKPIVRKAYLTVRLEVLRNGAWRLASDWDYQVGTDGTLLLYIPGETLPVGTRGRLSAAWNGSTILWDAWTTWSYFRITA